MRTDKTIFWISTIIILLFEGVMPALTSQTELAKEGFRHLGYPDYFRIELTIFKVIGAIVLILPMVPSRIKEWAYAGFGITMISAFISYCAVNGFGFQAILPLIFLIALAVSYSYIHRLQKSNEYAIINLSYSQKN